MPASSDEELAAKLLQLFELLGASLPNGIPLHTIRASLKCSFATIKAVVRSRPAEYAMYKDNKRRLVMVVCFAYCSVSALKRCKFVTC
jgi:hypothetical protein